MYWAKRGYYRNDYGRRYYKVGDKKLKPANGGVKPVAEQTIKNEPAAKTTPEASRFVKTNTAAETLFATKMAERH